MLHRDVDADLAPAISWRQHGMRVLGWSRNVLAATRNTATLDARGLLALFALLMAVSFVLLWVGDKLNASGMAVTRFVARAQAPLSGEFYSPRHRDDIVVLQYDEEFLDANQLAWPIRYDEHAQWLLRLANDPQGLPRAIFLDISFGQKRPDASVSQLKDALCTLKRKHDVPVFVAALPSARSDHRLHIREDLASTSADDAGCFTLVGVSYTPDPVDRLAWTYPLSMHREGGTWKEGPSTDGQAPAYRNAALALAQDAGGVDLDPEAGSMALVWGARPPRATDDFQPPMYCDSAPTTYARYVPGLLRPEEPPETRRPVCPYHKALSMARLAEFDDDQLASHVAGKFVMIGAVVPGYNDLIDSPVHGLIPGIHLHAMALDNLLTFGNDYKLTTEWSMPPALGLALCACLTVGVVLLVHVLWSMIGRCLAPWLPARRPSPAVLRAAGLPRDARSFVLWLLGLLWRGALWCARLTLQAFAAICLITVLQSFFRIGMLPVSELVAMTLTAEVLGHVEKLRAFLLDSIPPNEGVTA